MEDIKKLAPLLKKVSEKRQPKDGTKLPGMKKVSMVIVFPVINLVTKPWTTKTMQNEVLEIPTILLGVGHVTVLVILLHIVIP